MVYYFNQRMISEQNQVSYNYDTFRQNLELSWSPGWDYSNEIDACNVVIAAFARQMAGQDLGAAVGGAKQTRKKRAWDHNLLYSQTNATKANVKAMQPVVRTQCYFQEWYYDGAPTDVPLADDEEFMPVGTLTRHPVFSYSSKVLICCAVPNHPRLYWHS